MRIDTQPETLVRGHDLVEEENRRERPVGPAGPSGDRSESEGHSRRSPATVLLVDDDGALLRLTWDILTEAGYTVLEARGGAEALVVLETWPEPIHLLLTDFLMPDINGLDLKAMASVLRPDLPALLVSGQALYRVRGAEGSNSHFLQRPFTRVALLRKVREILDGRSR